MNPDWFYDSIGDDGWPRSDGGYISHTCQCGIEFMGLQHRKLCMDCAITNTHIASKTYSDDWRVYKVMAVHDKSVEVITEYNNDGELIFGTTNRALFEESVIYGDLKEVPLT